MKGCADFYDFVGSTTSCGTQSRIGRKVLALVVTDREREQELHQGTKEDECL